MRLPLLITLLLAIIATGCSQTTEAVKTKVLPKPLLVDEYAVLDDAKSSPSLVDGIIRERLDRARAHYLAALKAVEADKEKLAAQHFEASIGILNNMMTHPEINSLPEYARLSRSVIRDYEGKITSIENLDSTSSFFVLRDKMFQEIELLPVSFHPAASEELTLETIDSLVIGLPENEAVQQTLDYFTVGRGRKYMALWLERSGRYFPLYEKILEEEGAPDELKYLSMIESGLSPRATSHAAAVGLWQFIASTGRAYGMHADWYRDERRDPEKATRAAARYLLDLYDQMGDWHLALGSYNCGPGRMRRALRRADSTDYWQARKHLPRETARYVPLYVAAAKIARDPAAFGFTEIDLHDPFEFEVVSVYAPYHFSTIAEVGGFPIQELKDLNPELLQEQVPPGDAMYDLRVPVGTAERISRTLDTLTVEAAMSTNWKRHKVKRGETVTKIARKYGVGVSEVLNANGMTSKSTLKRGTTIKIPMSGQTEAITPEMIAAAKAKAEEERINAIAEERAKALADEKSANQVVPGTSDVASVPPAGASPSVANSTETADPELVATASSEIPTAERKSTQPKDLPTVATAENTPSNAPSIFVNAEREESTESADTIVAVVAATNEAVQRDVALIPASDPTGNEVSSTIDVTSTPLSEPTAADPATTEVENDEVLLAVDASPSQPDQASEIVLHVVRKGETLSGIASRYGVSQSEIRSWNSRGITANNDVLLGAKLTIKTGESEQVAGAESTVERTDEPAITFIPTKKREVASQATMTRRYKVRRGETLNDIAAKFHVSVRTLQESNPRLGPNGVRAGQVILIR